MEWSVRNVILEWAFVPPVLVLARSTLRVRARDCRHRLSTVDLFDRDFIVLAGCGDQAWVDAVRARSEPNAPRIIGYNVAADGDLVPKNADFDRCPMRPIGLGEYGTRVGF